MARRHRLLLLVLVLASLGASYRSPHFVVQAPQEEVARQVARLAEQKRRVLALAWLGQELPAWADPCSIVVEPGGQAAGNTAVSFYEDQIVKQEVHLQGPLDHVLRSILPHELTHLVFAHRLRSAIPRWADEGGAMLSEAEQERGQWDRLAGEILDLRGQALPLRRFLSVPDQVADARAYYAQSYSLAYFLLESGDRPTFLAFVESGRKTDWDRAVRTHYHYRDVDALELAWVRWRRLPAVVRAAEMRLRRGQEQLARHESLRAQVSPTDLPAWEGQRDHYRTEVEQGRRALEQARLRPWPFPRPVPISP